MSVTALPQQEIIQQPTEALPSLIGMTLTELEALVVSLGEPKFRAQQLHHWIYVLNARDFDEMTNLSKQLREKLSGKYQVGTLTIKDKQVSRDGTIKYLFQLASGELIESVLMHFKDRDKYSVCISSQVGCAVDCKFCATGKLGFKKNLSIAEIVDQYLYVQQDSKKEVRNIVFMGQGEPMLNYDNLILAIKILNQSAEVGMRNITLSTSGIVPKIDKLAEENLQLTLAVSLHAADDETRDSIMPINKKWPVDVLMKSLVAYYNKTKRRITIEYVLLRGVNDSREHAVALGKLLRPLKCNINLIPYNPIGECYGFKRPSNEEIVAFQDALYPVCRKVITTRMERGTDIDAACGQLANKYQS